MSRHAGVYVMTPLGHAMTSEGRPRVPRWHVMAPRGRAMAPRGHPLSLNLGLCSVTHPLSDIVGGSGEPPTP